MESMEVDFNEFMARFMESECDNSCHTCFFSHMVNVLGQEEPMSLCLLLLSIQRSIR